MDNAEKDLFNEKSKITWWEKTVEYSYVLNHMSEAALAVPLDGNHEAAGDSFFSECDSWIVIEFKRTQDFESEDVKYAEAGKRKVAELKSKYKDNDSAPHFFVYGSELKNNKLELKAKRYWSREEISLENLLASGTSYDEFKKYIEDIIEAKKGSATEGASGFGSVVGAQAGKLKTTTTVAEFARDALHMKKLLQEHQRIVEQQTIIRKSSTLGLG